MSSSAARRAWRVVIANEEKARRTGSWGRWERHEGNTHPAFPRNAQAWFAEVHTVFKTVPEWLVVMVRTVPTEWGAVEHLIIRTAKNAELRWREKQRIKDELAGPERFAVEVFPAVDRVVDDEQIFHLWVMPAGFQVEFGIHPDDAQSGFGRSHPPLPVRVQ